MIKDFKVPYLDLVEQFSDPDLRREILKVFDHCQFILGPSVENFEKRFAEICQVRFALGVNSGTDAIFLALKALGIGIGDEVITVANSFIATVGAVVSAGAVPVFVDVGNDYNMDTKKIEPVITCRTRAIIPVHLTGCPAQMNEILGVADKHGLFVIEDAAQAVGSAIDGKPVGGFGHIGCFSLHPLKNLNVAGDGGVLTTDSETLYLRLKQLRNHGLKNRDEIETFGYNSRLDALQAAVGIYNIQKLDEVTNKRIRHAKRYDNNLAGLEPKLTIPKRFAGIHQTFHTYVVMAKERSELVDALLNDGIETKIHYPVPIHFQAPCTKMGWKKGDLPETENQSGKIISLPIHQFLNEEQIDYVSEKINEFYWKREYI
jgi:dTDP-4-amino-4,6-dideoxygalactose transaminase